METMPTEQQPTEGDEAVNDDRKGPYVSRIPSSGPPQARLPSRRGQFNTSSVGFIPSEAEIEQLLQDAETEDSKRQTLSRRFVEKFLINKKWYFPQKFAGETGPSLRKAWAYYEHITLARHFVGEGSGELQRAEPGQRDDPDKNIHTELYSPWTTPESRLNEWGLGVGVYFTTVRIMAFIFLIAGLINIANIAYYSSSEYSGDRPGDLAFALTGSTVCTRTEWVVCAEGCTEDRFDEDGARLAVGVDGEGDGLVFALRNDCLGAELGQGMVNWASFVFVMVSVILLGLYQRLREIRFDEDKLTSTDYSILVKNPPPDALDPEEWREFFSQFAEKQVTAVTIALNNGDLVHKLILRRIYRDKLRRQLPKDVDMDNEDEVRIAVDRMIQEREDETRTCMQILIGCTVLPILRLFDYFLLPETLVDKIFKAEEDIKELQKEKYDATNVFVTYETEAGQRAALSALNTSKMEIMSNHAHSSVPLFKDRVLQVEEPTEPNAVRWIDLHVSKKKKILIRLMNLGITVALIAFAGYLVDLSRQRVGPFLSGPLVSVFNSTIPLIVKILMIFERHSTEGSFQKSLYLKITLFRWVNTAIIVQIITPFTATINDGNSDVLRTINGILWSELWITPTLRLLDIVGNIRKHIFAPRERNQETMNLNFQGTPYNLGERYTDFTKVLFLCFYYSSLFPATFFFGFGILIIQYYADKWCLMRIWSSAPFIGNEIAIFSRRYFFSLALVVFAIVSSYAYASFPYDNVCDPDNPLTGFSGNYTATTLDGDTITITVSQDEAVVFCNQRISASSGFSFPAVASQQGDIKWMTDSQESLSNICGWTSVVVLVVMVVAVLGGIVTRYIRSWCCGTYSPEGTDQRIDFSTDQEIFAYVPQIKKSGYPFPFVCADVDNVSDDLIGWTDRNHSRDYHNVIFDMPYSGMKRKRDAPEDPDASERKERPMFSIIKHWPPEWSKNDKDD